MKGILYDWGGLNTWLFHLINDIRATPLDAVMQLGTFLGGHQLFWVYLILIILLRIALIKPRGLSGLVAGTPESVAWQIAILTFALTYLVDYWLVGWVKQVFTFPRPPLVFPAESIHLLTTKSDLNHSLPSGHTWFAMTIAASLWPIARTKVRWVLACFVLWVGTSRVSLGIHFPADVAYGALFGFIVVVAVRQCLRLFIRIRQPAS